MRPCRYFVFEAMFIVPQFIPDMDEVTRDALQVRVLICASNRVTVPEWVCTVSW